jgi:hypothetical protein
MALAEDTPLAEAKRWPRRRDVGLWFGLLGGPFASLADVIVSDAYVEATEMVPDRALLLAIGAVAAALTVLAGAIAWRIFKRINDEPERTRSRVRFMAVGGVVVSAYSLLVIAALLVPKLGVAPGDRL